MSFRRSVIIAEFWRPEVARFGTFSKHFFAFFWKTTPYDKIFKILLGKFTSRHRSTLLCTKFVKIVSREIGEIVRDSCDQKNNKISAPSQTVATAQIAPKVCHGQPPWFGSQYSKFHPNRFTFGRVISGRVKAVKIRLKVSPSTRRSYSFSPSKLQCTFYYSIIIIYTISVIIKNTIPTIQCSAWSARQFMHKLFTSCNRRGFTWLNSRWWMAACDWVMNCDASVSAVLLTWSTLRNLNTTRRSVSWNLADEKSVKSCIV